MSTQRRVILHVPLYTKMSGHRELRPAGSQAGWFPQGYSRALHKGTRRDGTHYSSWRDDRSHYMLRSTTNLGWTAIQGIAPFLANASFDATSSKQASAPHENATSTSLMRPPAGMHGTRLRVRRRMASHIGLSRSRHSLILL